MTVVLLISAMLIAASLIRVLRVDPGFEIDRGLIADLRPAGSTGQQIAFFDQLLERVEALPGVERACAINNVPLDNAGASMTFVAEGQTDADRRSALPMGASDGCFDALRIDLLRGRPFQRTETESVTIVTESMAKALWPDGSDPVGKRIHIGLVSGPLFRVVGVVGDIRATSLEAVSGRQVWMSASRGWPIPQRVIVRTAVEPRSLARPLREVVAALNPDLALANVRTMGDIVGEATASRRFVLALLGGFASIALVLCVVGLYGVLSYQVGRRSREIGIRVALGARRGHVVRTITAQTMISVVLGIAAGAIGARALSPIIASQLFEMSATDVRVYACVAGFVIVLAALACWSPIRRVLAIDPVAVLRSE
jgi:predicted permease